MFGNMPACALFARHVKALTAHDVVITLDTPDARPAVRLQDVAGADLEHVTLPRTPGAPAIVLRRLTDFFLRNSPGLADTRRPGMTPDSVVSFEK